MAARMSIVLIFLDEMASEQNHVPRTVCCDEHR